MGQTFYPIIHSAYTALLGGQLRAKVWQTRKYLRNRFLKDLLKPARMYRHYLYDRHGLHAASLFALQLLDENTELRYSQPLISLPQYKGLLPPGRKAADPSEQRWKLLQPHLRAADSFLDVGSENGFLAFKMAPRVKFALGLERDPKGYRVASALAPLNSTNVAFLHCGLELSMVRSLPVVDTLACVSVFHQLVVDFGLADATMIMSELSKHCRHQLLFETGQNDEPVAAFATSLSFMGQDPRRWIKEFLGSLGFTEVLYVGLCPTSVSGVPRHLFVANRNPTTATEVLSDGGHGDPAGLNHPALAEAVGSNSQITQDGSAAKRHDFRGCVSPGIGRFSELVIPGRAELKDAPPDWPERLHPGSLNIEIVPSGFPDCLPDMPTHRGAQKLDLGFIPPLASIPAGLIGNNTIQPTETEPWKGIGFIWRASLTLTRTGQEIPCWVLRRSGSGIHDQLEIISHEHLRTTYGLVNKTPVQVTLWSGNAPITGAETNRSENRVR